ncbi:MAG: hypothetical protein KAT74_03465 [Candidatus Cloacimonetes bacterium]|nr:hypothetical protein [Candidatus Cloacimonadota bacterium]
MKAHIKMIIFISLLIIFGCSAKSQEITIDKNAVEKVKILYKRLGSTYEISLKLNDEYTEKLYEITKENIGKELIIMFGDEIFTKASIEVGIPNGQIRGGNFKTEEEALIYLKGLLEEKFSEIYSDYKFVNNKFNENEVDSLIKESYQNFYNYDFNTADFYLSQAYKLLPNYSEKHTSIFIAKLLMYLQMGDYKSAQIIFNEYKNWFHLNSDKILKPKDLLFESGRSIEIILLITNNNYNKAYQKAKELKRKVDSEQPIIPDFMYYSYVWYKLGDTKKALEILNKHIDLFSLEEYNDISYLLVRAIYLTKDKNYKSALENVKSILNSGIKTYKYDAVKVKLWYSLILNKLNKQDEAISFLQNALEEKMIHDPEDKVPISMLLSPYPGIFPSEDIYEDLEFLMNLIQKTSNNNL